MKPSCWQRVCVTENENEAARDEHDKKQRKEDTDATVQQVKAAEGEARQNRRFVGQCVTAAEEEEEGDRMKRRGREDTHWELQTISRVLAKLQPVI